jgi:hypothetical protein
VTSNYEKGDGITRPDAVVLFCFTMKAFGLVSAALLPLAAWSKERGRSRIPDTESYMMPHHSKVKYNK